MIGRSRKLPKPMGRSISASQYRSMSAIPGGVEFVRYPDKTSGVPLNIFSSPFCRSLQSAPVKLVFKSLAKLRFTSRRLSSRCWGVLLISFFKNETGICKSIWIFWPAVGYAAKFWSYLTECSIY